MAINMYNIKKWYNMLIGKSALHAKQEIGKIYSKSEIKGYYNDLTLKVKNETHIVNNIPLFLNERNELEEFSIMIFQYGLGAYDLYLQNIEKEENLARFSSTLQWAIKNQQENGAWVTFRDKKEENTYSSMAQGEGASLLLRGYIEFKEKKYFEKAKLAIKSMMKPIEENGTTLYTGEEIYLKECIDEPVILNGWIFSLWGLYDYLKVDKNNKQIKEFYEKTVETLSKKLKCFDNGYWSKYNTENMIASPFYHDLHIQQLKVMFDITNNKIFQVYANKFEDYEKKSFNRKKAFLKKAIQKIMEK